MGGIDPGCAIETDRVSGHIPRTAVGRSWRTVVNPSYRYETIDEISDIVSQVTNTTKMVLIYTSLNFEDKVIFIQGDTGAIKPTAFFINEFMLN